MQTELVEKGVFFSFTCSCAGLASFWALLQVPHTEHISYENCQASCGMLEGEILTLLTSSPSTKKSSLSENQVDILLYFVQANKITPVKADRKLVLN